MEALNGAPLSVLCKTRTQEPRKLSPLINASHHKVPIFASFKANPRSIHESFSRNLGKGLVVLASVLSNTAGLAKALTYEEALQQSVTSLTGSDFVVDASGAIDSLISFVAENPVVVAGGAFVLAVPLVLSQVLSNSKAYGVESAKKAYAVLGDDASAQLLDIRAPEEFRKVGSPDIRGLGKKPVSIAYKGGDKFRFLKKLALKFKEPENTTLFILDKFDGNSELVAELVSLNGFKAAYAIKDGAEGSRGWLNSGLPWIPPNKALSFDLSSITESLSDSLGDTSDAVALAIGAAAAAGIGLLAFSEIETILEVFGTVALVQFASKKLLFAEDRKETLRQVNEFLNTKVAPKELVADIKEIGNALLPTTPTTNALPAPAEAAPGPKVEAVAAEPPPQINSVPKTEPVSASARPLSPYPSYPDFKPPSSPTPSQP